MVGYLILATAICALIDALRIKAVKGEVVNINKRYTVLFGELFCIVGVFIYCSHPHISFLQFIINTLIFCLLFVSVRGVFYDAILNKMRGLKIDYESETTNSEIDHIETDAKLGFWTQRIIYLLASIVFYLIFKLVA